MALHALSLCSGIGGLDLALRSLGVVSVGYVERDAYAAAVLVARMEEARLDCAPIWSDLATFNPHPWRGAVDLVAAGYPCQPFSQAGLRLGANDPRHLWPHVRRIIDGSGCVGAVLENVSGHVRLGLRDVLRDLAAIGFHAEWGLFSAAEAGAPHRRERLFILAYRDVDGLRRLWSDRLLDGEREALGDDANGRRGAHAGMGDPSRSSTAGREWPSGDDTGRGGPDLPGEVMGDALLPGLEGGRPSESRGRRGSRPTEWPPGPLDRVAWARVLERDPLLAPALPKVRGVARGPARLVDCDRNDRLRCLGNVVVPDQAELAIRELVRRALK